MGDELRYMYYGPEMGDIRGVPLDEEYIYVSCKRCKFGWKERPAHA